MTDSGPVVGEDRVRKFIPIVPIIISILSVMAWLIFILLYALFWSKGYSLFQNIVVTFVTLAIMGLMVGIVWVMWSFTNREIRREWIRF